MKKNTFPLVFHFLGANFSGFRRNFSTTAVRIDLVSRRFNPVSAIVFKEFTQIFIDRFVRTALDVSTGLFSWETSSLKKNTFPIVFHILGRNFISFRQMFSSTVVGNASASSFFNRIYAIFFRTSPKILLVGLSELHTTCSQDSFYGVHLL